MRNNPILTKGTIHAEDARIFWDPVLGKVAVAHVNDTTLPEVDAYRFCGGACYAIWQINCQDKKTAQILCLKEFWNLVYIYEMDPVVVDEALSNIIEYQETFLVKSGGEPK
jgi:hypothetical protein